MTGTRPPTAAGHYTPPATMTTGGPRVLRFDQSARRAGKTTGNRRRRESASRRQATRQRPATTEQRLPKLESDVRAIRKRIRELPTKPEIAYLLAWITAAAATTAAITAPLASAGT